MSLCDEVTKLGASCVWKYNKRGLMQHIKRLRVLGHKRVTLPSMEPLMKYLSSTGWKSNDVTKSVCLQHMQNHKGSAITSSNHSMAAHLTRCSDHSFLTTCADAHVCNEESASYLKTLRQSSMLMCHKRTVLSMEAVSRNCDLDQARSSTSAVWPAKVL